MTLIKSLHLYSCQRGTISDKWKDIESEGRAEFELECLLIILIYSHSKLVVICKKGTLKRTYNIHHFIKKQKQKKKTST